MNITPLALSSIIHKKWYNIIFISLAILILILFYLIPTPAGLTNEGKIMIGILLSAIVGSLVEAFTGSFLKKIFLNIPIYGDFSFSISAFTVATLVVRVLLFGF